MWRVICQGKLFRQSLERNRRENINIVEMDSVQHEYLRVNKYYMCITCTWPYQSVLQKCLIGIVCIPILLIQLTLQAGGLVTAIIADDTDAFVEGCSIFIATLMCQAMYINFFYNYKQMKRLLDIMQEDWKIYRKQKHEFDLLCEQYAIGKKISLTFGALILGILTPFAALPLMVNAVSALGLYDISDERPIVLRVEHFVNLDKYYYPLLIQSYFGTMGYAVIAVALNSMIVMYVQHECGLCEILRVRLEKFVENDSMSVELHPKKFEDRWYKNARECVVLHTHIIEFAQILEGAHTTSYLFHLGLSMFCISFTQFQAIINLNDTAKAFRYVSITISLLWDLLFISWPGQQLSDVTESIFQYTTNGKWYQASINSRKLLAVMLLKSMAPLKLTACKLYTLNLESFSTVLRTSFSYTMVLCSLQ